MSYQQAFNEVFEQLDELEQRLKDGRTFLLGERLTEADIRLFVTLIRFDVAYHGLFKCNLRRLRDYPLLDRYLKSVLAVSGVRQTVNIDHIKQGDYSIKALNPNGIVPAGPDMADYGFKEQGNGKSVSGVFTWRREQWRGFGGAGATLVSAAARRGICCRARCALSL